MKLIVVRLVTVAIAGIALSSITNPLLAQDQSRPASARTAAEVIEAAPDDDWRALDPENTVYFELPGGRVVVELAPGFAPTHVANIKALVRGGYFDGGAVQRSQDNYVAQWGPRALAEGEMFSDDIASALPPEFEVAASGQTLTSMPDGDVYAPVVGFVDGFPVGHEPASEMIWMAHCYGVVGVARGNDPGSGNGGGLYAVTGHAPRHLDRNLTMVGRVVVGMEHLSSLPRGTGNLGFYETPEEHAVFESARLGSDLPVPERSQIQQLRTDTQSFRDFVVASRSRGGEFFVHSAERIDLCNVRIPTRPAGGD